MNINGYVPKRKLSTQNLISLQSAKTEDIFELLYFARDVKRMKIVGENLECLKNQYVAMLTKPAYVRSRIAFQIAVEELEGHPIIVPLTGSEIEEALKDPDTTMLIKNFGTCGFVVDTSFLHDAEVIDSYAHAPIINANGRSSPCQSLAILLTIWEQLGKLQGLKLAVIGDVNYGDYSLLAGATKCGMDLSIICPDDYDPPREVLDYCQQFGSIDLYDNIEDGVRGADVILVMGHEFGKEYLFTDRYLKYAHRDAILLHTLPINRGVDISEEALNYSNSHIFEQANNALPVLKAALALVMGKMPA